MRRRSGPIFQVVQKMFEQRTGTTFTYIAFRANSEAMMSLMRGDALMSLSDIGPADRCRTAACARSR